MNFISYAQNFEDVMLWRALSDVTPGNYIDIGAQDPVVDSVSRAFYEAGWRGIHVEPTLHYAAALRRDRPDELVIEAVIGAEAGLTTFYEIPETGLSTGIAGIAEHHQATGWKAIAHTLPEITLASLLDQLNGKDVHWLKIDVEGMEPEVLRGWGDHPARPWILVIESTVPNSQEPTHHAWIDEVTGRGYREVYFDGLSRYFLAEGQEHRAKAFEAPPNIFDQFHVESHHFSTALLKTRMDAALDAVRTEHDAHLQELRTRIATLELDRETREQEHLTALALRDSELATNQKRLQEYEEALACRDSELTAVQTELSSMHHIANNLASLLCEIRSSRGWRWTAGLRKFIEPRRFRYLTTHLNAALRAQPIGQGMPDAVPSDQQIVTQTELSMIDPSHSIKPARNLQELLAPCDQEFVDCAFRTVLGRDPDPEGEAYYLAHLRSGRAKIHILRQMRLSEEGQQHDPGIAGLDRSIFKYRMANIPIFGIIMRFFFKEERNSLADLRFRILLNEIGKINSQHNNLIKKLISSLGHPAESNPDAISFEDVSPRVHNIFIELRQFQQ